MERKQKGHRVPFIPTGVVVDDDQAHLCVLADDGWPHYTSVPIDDPAQWRRALATLADPSALTLGKRGRPSLRRPIWLGLEVHSDKLPSSRLLALVLLPKGKLSFVTPTETEAYASRINGSVECRFDRAELLAHYVLRNQPPSEDEWLLEAGCAAGLACARRARG